MIRGIVGGVGNGVRVVVGMGRTVVNGKGGCGNGVRMSYANGGSYNISLPFIFLFLGSILITFHYPGVESSVLVYHFPMNKIIG